MMSKKDNRASALIRFDADRPNIQCAGMPLRGVPENW